ncbi:MAG: GIY-YIG nuclease family protein [Patescibacteria group bacterium]|nr:GIY-YIG nuclease family protein [Patescibacteria group bacterium]
MAYTVYVLYSQKDRGLYVGCTSNISERLERHLNGQVRATANRRPFDLIHTEQFESVAEAFERERFLKSLWGAREKKKILLGWLKGMRS